MSNWKEKYHAEGVEGDVSDTKKKSFLAQNKRLHNFVSKFFLYLKNLVQYSKRLLDEKAFLISFRF